MEDWEGTRQRRYQCSGSNPRARAEGEKAHVILLGSYRSASKAFSRKEKYLQDTLALILYVHVMSGSNTCNSAEKLTPDWALMRI